MNKRRILLIVMSAVFIFFPGDVSPVLGNEPGRPLSGKYEFSNPVNISNIPGDSKIPALAAAGDGNVYVAWMELDDRGKGNILFKRSTDGGAHWNTPIDIADISVGTESGEAYIAAPTIALDGAGKISIAWAGFSSRNKRDIYFRFSSDYGRRWAKVINITQNSAESYWPDLAIDSAGNINIIWMQLYNSYTSLLFSRSTDNGAHWTPGEIIVSSPYGGDIYNPAISLGGAGDINVSWSEVLAYYTLHTGADIFFSRSIDSGKSWTTGINLSNRWEDQIESDFPNIALDRGGNVTVLWSDYKDLLFSLSSDDGASWSRGAGVFSGPDPFPSRSRRLLWPRIAQDSPGNIYVTWQIYSLGKNYIYFSGPTGTGSSWCAPIEVSSGSESPEHPDIALDASGNIFIVWQDKGDIFFSSTGERGDGVTPVAVMKANRLGGMAPVTIDFDGSGSYDPDGTIERWTWDFGDGLTATGAKVSHTYDQPGMYPVILGVMDNSGRWDDVTTVVKVFSPGSLEARFSFDTQVVKAWGKGNIQVEAGCYEKQADLLHEMRIDPVRENNPITLNLGLEFTATSGSWGNEMSFISGIYRRTLVSGNPGKVTVSALLEDVVIGTTVVEFTWPRPPVNVALEVRVNRSLFSGEYYVDLSWSANPDEVFTPAAYRVYRSADGGAFELVAEVDAATFSYSDKKLPAGKQYAYALSMIDAAGDESDLSTPVTLNK